MQQLRRRVLPSIEFITTQHHHKWCFKDNPICTQLVLFSFNKAPSQRAQREVHEHHYHLVINDMLLLNVDHLLQSVPFSGFTTACSYQATGQALWCILLIPCPRTIANPFNEAGICSKITHIRKLHMAKKLCLGSSLRHRPHLAAKNISALRDSRYGSTFEEWCWFPAHGIWNYPQTSPIRHITAPRSESVSRLEFAVFIRNESFSHRSLKRYGFQAFQAEICWPSQPQWSTDTSQLHQAMF